MKLKRRDFLALSGSYYGATIAGCVEPGFDDPNPDLRLIIEQTRNTSGEWEIEVLSKVGLAALNDVVVYGYDTEGGELCRHRAGSYKAPNTPGSTDKEFTLRCPELPAVITATASPSPCEGADIPIRYLDQSERSNYGLMDRRCDEPPVSARVLANISTDDQD